MVFVMIVQTHRECGDKQKLHGDDNIGDNNGLNHELWFIMIENGQ